jgi:hypothetical protein
MTQTGNLLRRPNEPGQTEEDRSRATQRANAGRLEEDERADEVRTAGRETHGDQAPHRVSDDDGGRGLLPLEKLGYEICIRSEVGLMRRRARTTVAREIRDQHPSSLGQPGCEKGPVAGGAAEPVNEDERFSLAPLEPPNPAAPDLRKLRAKPGQERCLRHARNVSFGA